jgi:hypothetical protein
MSTVGWFFILAAILVMRQVAKGRVLNTMEDLSDAFLAIVQGDSDALAGVVTRTGDYNLPSRADIEEGMAPAEGIAGNSLLEAAVNLGQRAKGYRWTATGPDYYDCSGLVWKAATIVGYDGPRFTTYDVKTRKGFSTVTSPIIGDVVLWHANSKHSTGHMGVVSGKDQFYSSRSVRSGIGYSKISSFRSDAPEYLRYSSISESARRAALVKQNAGA